MKTTWWRPTAVAFLLLALPALGADYPREAGKEELVYYDQVVIVERVSSCTAEDLGLPFYPQARPTKSFAYRITTRDGKPVVHYAMAELEANVPPARVAEYYRDQLPGHPVPEEINDREGRRLVLAVAAGEEVRMVSISAAGDGSRLRLVRATRPHLPEARPKPILPEPRPPGMPRGRRGRGYRA